MVNHVHVPSWVKSEHRFQESMLKAAAKIQSLDAFTSDLRNRIRHYKRIYEKEYHEALSRWLEEGPVSEKVFEETGYETWLERSRGEKRVDH